MIFHVMSVMSVHFHFPQKAFSSPRGCRNSDGDAEWTVRSLLARALRPIWWRLVEEGHYCSLTQVNHLLTRHFITDEMCLLMKGTVEKTGAF